MNDTKTALYRHYDSTGTLLYVGISLSVINRLSKHNLNSNWFSDIAKIEIDWLDNRKAALFAEGVAINTEHPRFNIYHVNENSSQEKIATGWRNADKYYNREGKLVLEFKEEMIPHLSNPFSRCKIKLIDKIKSKRAVLLYEIFASKAWENQLCEIKIDTLRSMFNIQDKYKAFANIKQKVIEPAVTEINHCSNIEVRYELIKSGKKVSAIQFTFEYKT